ncbi:MAG: hypothetical protein ACKV2U_26170 [Bryobacteraceae bacterium]
MNTRNTKGDRTEPAKSLAPEVRLAKRMLGTAAGTIQYTEGWDPPMSDADLDGFPGA